MPSINELPLASGDLAAIAEVLSLIDNEPTGIFTSPLIGRIEILRPDSDKDEVIGHLVQYDDWYGFLPIVD